MSGRAVHVRWGVLVAVALASLGCERLSGAAEPRAELGLFFGGQVQERQTIPVARDAAKPPVGFRISLPQAETTPLEVHWEVDRPGTAGRRVRRSGSAELPAGQTQLDQLLELRADDPLGLWNVRVSLGDRLVIDRALLLIERPLSD